MTSQYALTPLKMKANDLVTVHYDIYPTETFPGLNRSPSFIDVKDKNEGLIVSFSKKKVLLPIGCKSPEDKKPALVLLPTPPSQPSPTDGQAAAIYEIHKKSTYRTKSKIPGIGKVIVSMQSLIFVFLFLQKQKQC